MSTMHKLVGQHRDALEQLCRRHHVRQLDLFGSASGQTFDNQRSDLDFVVVFQPDVRRGFDGDYFGLQRDMEQLFQRPVDLIEAQTIENPYLLQEIERQRVTLYAA